MDDSPSEQMNHKTERITKDHKTATTLVVLAAVAAVLLTSIAAIGTGHIALANNSKAGISLPTDTKTKTRVSNCRWNISGHRLLHRRLPKRRY